MSDEDIRGTGPKNETYQRHLNKKLLLLEHSKRKQRNVSVANLPGRDDNSPRGSNIVASTSLPARIDEIPIVETNEDGPKRKASGTTGKRSISGISSKAGNGRKSVISNGESSLRKRSSNLKNSLPRDPRPISFSKDELPTDALKTPISKFGDLVLYNDEGKPYIDVNRLIYHPRDRVKKEVKERLSWYIADYVFIISNFISLVSSAYILSVGMMAITWSSSILSVNDIDPNAVILKISKDYGPESIGLTLIATAAANLVNVLLGLFSCIFGYKTLLIMHVVVDIGMLATQSAAAAVTIIGGRCNITEIDYFQNRFEGLIRNYTRPEEDSVVNDGSVDEPEEFYAATQLNDIQISMQCCGASNWTDYLNPRVLQNSSRVGSLDGSEMVFPFSCCRAWWVRNLHCAEGAHHWAYPGVDEETALKFRERINPAGCVATVWLNCQRLLFLLGWGIIVNGIFSGILIALELFAVILQVRSLNTMLREMKSLKENKADEKDVTTETEGEDILSSLSALAVSASSFDKFKTGSKTKLRTIEDLKELVPLPTEDEIQFVKNRTVFAKFESQTKQTSIGKMMRQVKSSNFAPIDEDGIVPFVPKRRASQLSTPSRKPHHHHHHHHHRHKAVPKPESPPETPVPLEEVVSEITETSIKHYGKRKKHKKSKKRVKKSPKVVEVVKTVTVYELSVPSHVLKKKKVPKNPKPVEALEEEPLVEESSPPHTTASKKKKRRKKKPPPPEPEPKPDTRDGWKEFF